MAFLLRLPDALDDRARQRAQELGISLNAVMCVALDAWLREPQRLAQASGDGAGDVIERSSPGGSVLPQKAPQVAPQAKPSKSERRELTRLARLARKG